MRQDEIDEISDAFHDAWKEFFGMEMNLITMKPKDQQDSYDDLYGEDKKKDYEEGNKLSFFGTFKVSPIVEEGDLGGLKENVEAEITFVTKELFDKGIKQISNKDIIEVTQRSGNIKRYNIVQNYGKVQLGDNHIFTKMMVAEIKS
jgi:FKBP-type peptidyl-prolyl cis-trans isomerase (trigger factor)